MNTLMRLSLLTLVALSMGCASNDNAAQKTDPKILTKPKITREIRAVAPEFREDAPERYVVQRGDTLWQIAATFLQNPGRWKEIWYANPSIKNPNKIYPGDILSYKTIAGERKVQVAGSNSAARAEFTGKKTASGLPIYNVSPGVREESLIEPIPAIPKEVVLPFITKNLIMAPGFSEDYPYVIGQSDGGFLSLSGRQKIYAKTDDQAFADTQYNVFREEGNINDPVTGELLGVEAVYVGQLKLVAEANEDGIATFVQTDSVNPLFADDILMPTQQAKIGGNLDFLPKLPNIDNDEPPVVIRPLGKSGHSTASQFSTLLINLGSDDGIETGDVFRIMRANERTSVGRDGQPFRLPDYEVGLGIVYKLNALTSYVLVMNAYDVIYPGDRLLRP